MEEHRDKAKIIRENIESTIGNAIEAENMIVNASPKKQRELIAKNERRADAVVSMISDMKVEEAKEELEQELD